MCPVPHSLQEVEPGFESSVRSQRSQRSSDHGWKGLGPYGDSLGYGHPHLLPPGGPMTPSSEKRFTWPGASIPAPSPSRCRVSWLLDRGLSATIFPAV